MPVSTVYSGMHAVLHTIFMLCTFFVDKNVRKRKEFTLSL